MYLHYKAALTAATTVNAYTNTATITVASTSGATSGKNRNYIREFAQLSRENVSEYIFVRVKICGVYLIELKKMYPSIIFVRVKVYGVCQSE